MIISDYMTVFLRFCINTADLWYSEQCWQFRFFGNFNTESYHFINKNVIFSIRFFISTHDRLILSVCRTIDGHRYISVIYVCIYAWICVHSKKKNLSLKICNYVSMFLSLLKLLKTVSRTKYYPNLLRIICRPNKSVWNQKF